MVGNIPYTPRVKKVLALAGKEAKSLNHSYVGTEHILLGPAPRRRRRGRARAEKSRGRYRADPQRNPEGTRSELHPARKPSRSSRRSRRAGGGKEVKTPALRAFGRDLTELAQKGRDRSGDRTQERNRARHPGALPPHEKQSRAHRRGRRGQDRDRRRGSRRKSPAAMCRSCCATKKSSRSTSR
jgi:hypothetical protein